MNAILVYRTAALGDFVMACPALRIIRRLFADRRIVLLTTVSAQRDLRRKAASYAGTDSPVPWTALATPHLVDEVVAIPDVRSLRSLLDARVALGKFTFDRGILLLDPGTSARSRLLKLVLIKLLVGFIPVLGWRAPGMFTRSWHVLNRRGHLQHHVVATLQFLAEMTPRRKLSDEDIQFDLRPNQTSHAWAKTWIQDHRRTGAPLIAIAPGSIQPHKRWPIANFIKLCEALLLHYPRCVIVAVGTPADHDLGAQLSALDSLRVINLAGRTTIDQSAALFGYADLVIGNDGGAAHLADAMGTRVISIVPGIEYPNSIEPWNNRTLAIRHKVSCAPCYSFTYCPAGNNKCMTDISVSTVLTRCMDVLRTFPTE